MSIPEKLQSTKLGLAGVAIYLLAQADASPWAIVAVAGIYMACNAIQAIGTKDASKNS
jgi:hypothetical protein